MKYFERYLKNLFMKFHISFRTKNDQSREEGIDLALLDLKYLLPDKRQWWERRINDVLSCPDNKFIPRVNNAGSIKDGFLVMHNGIKVLPLSYSGYPMLKMLIENKGVHEPQEERVFFEILKKMPERAVMMELGCYWSFYSMCLTMRALSQVKKILMQTA
ncbi:MAG: hypothetical protein HY753_08545 [Nitrospirae bacterium]|nr:hypothetical protein [Nitrospirota bacterium]